MKFSASSLNTLTKCGHKFYLEKVAGEKEPGLRGYNMLLGDVVGAGIQRGVELLNKQKSLSDADIAFCLYEAYAEKYEKAGIKSDPDTGILKQIHDLLLFGEGDEVMTLLDPCYPAINAGGVYEFKQPEPLKGGKVSQNKKKPPFCMTVVYSLEAMHWFFDQSNWWYDTIKEAVTVKSEMRFDVPIGNPYTVTMNDSVMEEQDLAVGYFDTFLTLPDGTMWVFEYKYYNTAYTQSLTDRLTQVLMYDLGMHSRGNVVIFDVKERKELIATVTPRMRELFLNRVAMTRKMLDNQIYLPACGTDPYTDSRILCGFKSGGGCEYGCSAGTGEAVPMDAE